MMTMAMAAANIAIHASQNRPNSRYLQPSSTFAAPSPSAQCSGGWCHGGGGGVQWARQVDRNYVLYCREQQICSETTLGLSFKDVQLLQI